MYCILVTGIPAADKSTMAVWLADKLKLPVISKDSIKELLFDNVGFMSRQEKVKPGTAALTGIEDLIRLGQMESRLGLM